MDFGWKHTVKQFVINGLNLMFSPKKNITITVKLFGGLDSHAGMEKYDPDVGVNLGVPDRIRLGKAIKKIGLGKTNSISLFINGNPAGPRERLNHGDIIFCMRPLAGG
ncbi:MAG: hypothetical protein JRI53_03490 [Deltaproteobacteria bacterium]|nr:hypothetical protein [Deltaproteobacteria bacterium]